MDIVTSYVCVDVETTGLNHKTDKLIEIGAVKVKDGVVADCFQSFVCPARSLDSRIVELTHITDEMLSDAPQPCEVMPAFLAFCEDLPLVGHNLSFDYAFLKKAMVNEKLSFERSGIDTLRIARKYLPELESRSLGYLCRYFEITHTAHRALGDAQATSMLYEKLCTLFGEKAQKEDCKAFSASVLHYNVKREKSITIAQKQQVTRYCNALGITLNWDLDKMSRSEASRFVEKHRLAFLEHEKGIQE